MNAVDEMIVEASDRIAAVMAEHPDAPEGVTHGSALLFPLYADAGDATLHRGRVVDADPERGVLLVLFRGLTLLTSLHPTIGVKWPKQTDTQSLRELDANNEWPEDGFVERLAAYVSWFGDGIIAIAPTPDSDDDVVVVHSRDIDRLIRELRNLVVSCMALTAISARSIP